MTTDSTSYSGYDTKLTVVNGKPAISYWDEINADLKYVRATDADGTNWGPPLTLDSMGYVGRANSMTVVNGTPAISYIDSGTNGQPNGALKYIRALDADGNNWAAPLSLDNVGYGGATTTLVVVNGTPAICYGGTGGANNNLKYLRSQDANGTNWGTPVAVAPITSSWSSLAVVNGNPAICYFDGSNGYGLLNYLPALDINGTSWESPVTVDGTPRVGSYSSLIMANGKSAISYYDLDNGNLKWAILASDTVTPDIAVSQASPLTDGVGSVSFGTAAIGMSTSLTFTITNIGTAPLTSLAVSNDGANSGDFIVSALSDASIPVGLGTVTFTVTFSPRTAGAKTATLHIASNVVGAKNPFDIAITGQSLSSANDTDGDGIDDATEFRFAAEGFDWQVNQASKVTAFKANLTASGYYTLAQIQTINVGTPLLQKDPATNWFKLTLALQRSTNLVDFSSFPMTAPQVQINSDGKLEFWFASPVPAEFYRIQASK